MSRRVFLLGADGLNPRYVEELLDRLPNFRRYYETAWHGELETVFPPVSPVAWGAVFTGRPPEEMGIYGWKKLLAGGRLVPVTLRDVQTPTIFDYLAAAGRRFGVIGFPLSDPPHPDASVWIRSHFDADRGAAVWPPDIGAHLERHFIELTFDALPAPQAARDYRLYRRYRQHCDAERVRAAVMLFDELELDLMMVHYSYTDNVIHSGHSRDDLESAYRELDRVLGHLLDTLPDDAVLMIVSDHGVETKRTDVALNRFLQHVGLLSLVPELSDDDVSPERLAACMRKEHDAEEDIELSVEQFSAMSPDEQRDVMWDGYLLRGTTSNVDYERSKALALSCYGQLYVMPDRGNQVSAARLEEVRETILEHRELLADPETGACLVEQVRALPTGSNEGEVLARLCIDFRDDAKVMVRTFPFTLETPFVSRRAHPFRGEHSPLGVYGVRDRARPGDRSARRSILSCAPSLLSLLEVRPPAEMSRPLLPGVEPCHGELVEVVTRAAGREAVGLSPEQEHEIADRLRALGYYD